MTNIAQFIHDVKAVYVEKSTHPNTPGGLAHTLRLRIFTHDGAEITIDTFSPQPLGVALFDEIPV